MPAAEFFELGHGFHLAEHRTFAFAGLWDRWHAADGAVVETCTMLTTEPNEAVTAVGHNRMPVIFTGNEEYARWLDPEVAERSPLEDLMRATPAEIWHVRPPSGDAAPRSARNAADGEQGRLFD